MSSYSALPAVDHDEKLNVSGDKTHKDAGESSAIGYPVQALCPASPFPVPQGVSPASPLGVWLEPDLFGCFNDMPVCCYGAWCLPCAFASNNVRISPIWESVPPGTRSNLSVPVNGLYCKAFWLLCLPGMVNGWLSPLLAPAAQGVLSLLTCGAQAYVGGEYRSRLRRKYQLPDRVLGIDGCPDMGVYLLCTPCAVCQEARELKRRGM